VRSVEITQRVKQLGLRGSAWIRRGRREKPGRVDLTYARQVGDCQEIRPRDKGQECTARGSTEMPIQMGVSTQSEAPSMGGRGTYSLPPSADPSCQASR